MKERRVRRFAVTGGCLMACMAAATPGCRTSAPGPDAAVQDLVPAQYSRHENGVELPACWWHAFERPVLDRLVREAFAGNLSLAQAEARVRQARATAAKAGAVLRPSVSAVGGAGVRRASTESQTTTTAFERATDTTESYSLGISVSYALDLWGEHRADRKTAEEQARASQEDWRAAALVLSGSVVGTWLELLEQRALLAVAKEQLRLNRTYLDLLKLRRRKGQATALDVLQQEVAVAAAQGMVPQREAGLAVAEHELAVLLGRQVCDAPQVATTSLPELPDVPSVGIPAAVLSRRPDVRAAWRRVEGGHWSVVSARADLLPAINLTAQSGVESPELSSLFDLWFATLAGEVIGPLLDGAKRRAEVVRTEAERDELLAGYRETVLTALQEVEDAMVREEKMGSVLQALEQELRAARQAFDEAMLRYRKGVSDYLPVLTALQSVQSLESEVIVQRRDLLGNRVNLYLALGGGMTVEETVDAPGSGKTAAF